MKIQMRVSTQIILILSLMALVYLGLSSCTAGINAVSVENRLLFADESSKQGMFSYGDMVVSYSYQANGSLLTISGKVDYQRSFDSLDVYLLLLDANGRVMQKKLVYASGFRTSTDHVHGVSFQESLVLPSATAGISFDSFAQERRSYK